MTLSFHTGTKPQGMLCSVISSFNDLEKKKTYVSQTQKPLGQTHHECNLSSFRGMNEVETCVKRLLCFSSLKSASR